MKVLITGARGLLGSAVAREVVGRGHDCVVVQRNPCGVPGVSEFLDDLTHPQLSREWINGVEAVIHLAAKVNVTGSERDFERINVDATRNLIKIAQAEGVSRFVFASSPSVAHTGKPLVGAGADPANPQHARGYYSKSKGLGEQIVLAANGPSFSTVALRPHLVWGPGDTQLIGRIVQRARSNRLFLIDGGHALIDTCYVSNAATAFVQAVENATRVSGRALMVTNGEPRTVKETLQRICLAAGVPLPTRSVPHSIAMLAGSAIERVWGQRESDPPLTSFLVEQLSTAHWFDITDTKRLLDWEPTISIDEGFRLLHESYSR
jgi:nucleoside-diphosphate-sugar epimerase